MTLVDAGPLVALVDQGDRRHEDCVEAMPRVSTPLVTTWPALSEAMYSLGDRVGWAAQERLWRLVLRGDLQVMATPAEQPQRVRDLMEKYRDLPMDLADASLVVLAESLRLRRIFTLDRDFRVYRIAGRRHFEIIP